MMMMNLMIYTILLSSSKAGGQQNAKAVCCESSHSNIQLSKNDKITNKLCEQKGRRKSSQAHKMEHTAWTDNRMERTVHLGRETAKYLKGIHA